MVNVVYIAFWTTLWPRCAQMVRGTLFGMSSNWCLLCHFLLLVFSDELCLHLPHEITRKESLRLTAEDLDEIKVPFWSKKAFCAWQQKQAGD